MLSQDGVSYRQQQQPWWTGSGEVTLSAAGRRYRMSLADLAADRKRPKTFDINEDCGNVRAMLFARYRQ